MNNYRRFRFIKPLTVADGTFKAGDEITILGERVYYNGGMVSPAYYNLLLDILESEQGEKYLREVPIPYNKA